MTQRAKLARLKTTQNLDDNKGRRGRLPVRRAKKNRAVARFQGCCVTLVKLSMVEPGGIEPPTSSLRTTRSPS